MDHLPPVSNSYNAVKIPYLGGEYDGQEFTGYPARHGWDLEKLQAGDLQNRTIADAGRFIQSWLYFGLMQEVVGIEILTADFIRVDGSRKRYVTTHKLREYLQRWRSQVDQEKASGPIEVPINRNKRAVACLTYAYNVWFNFDEDERGRFVGPEIGLSIHILASTLEHALTCVCEIPVADVPWRLERNDFLTRRMIDYGWCPSVVEQVCATNHLAFQYYASLLLAPSDPRVHEQCRAGHAGCSAKNIDDASYVTKHHLPHCKCGFITVDLNALRDIVQGGSIPLVYLEHRGPKTTIKTVPFRRGMQYTAVSHVWSDGLGNPTDNALPKCQLCHLEQLIAELPQYNQTLSSEDVPFDDRVWRDVLPYRRLEPSDQRPKDQLQYFWVDTLCVPLEPHKLRKEAIKNMRSVYSRATRVLVLDSALTQSTMDSCSEEKLARITISTWIRRLWTLQEAALARVTYFQFSGEPVIIVDEPRPAPGEKPGTQWYDNEVAYYAHLFEFSWWKKKASMTELDRICFVLRALRSRSTSHAEDQPICLALLLDLDMNELMDAPERRRMGKLWSLCGQLPASILFLPGTKLTDENLGWAPASCMDCTYLGIPDEVPATVTPDGLFVKLPGFLIYKAPPPPTHAVIACDLDGKTFYVRRNMKLGSPGWEGLDLHERDDLAVILGQGPLQNPSMRPPLVACVGALVRVRRTEKGIIFAEYVRMVSVIGKGSRFDSRPNPQWSDQEKIEKSKISQAAYTRADQRWCIGSLYRSSGAAEDK